MADLEALVDDRLRAVAEQYQLLRMATRTRTGEPAWAQVELLERGIEIPLAAEAHGDGPIDAALRAVVAALAIEARLVAFSVEALSTGADALAEAHVTVDVGGRHHTAEGVAHVAHRGRRAGVPARPLARPPRRAARVAAGQRATDRMPPCASIPTVTDLIGHTPIVRFPHVQPAGGATAARQARVHEPGRLDQGPDRRADGRRRGARRAAASPAAPSSSRPPATPASASRWSPRSAATGACS